MELMEMEESESFSFTKIWKRRRRLNCWAMFSKSMTIVFAVLVITFYVNHKLNNLMLLITVGSSLVYAVLSCCCPNQRLEAVTHALAAFVVLGVAIYYIIGLQGRHEEIRQYLFDIGYGGTVDVGHRTGILVGVLTILESMFFAITSILLWNAAEIRTE